MAFPTTSTLDDFNRTNGAPGANWSTEVVDNYFSMVITSNTLKEDSAGFGFDSNYWNPSTFGPDCEAFATISTKGSNSGHICARIQNPGDASLAVCYAIRLDSFDTYIRKLSGSTFTTLGSTLGVVIPAGDSVGIACIGTDIQCWQKPAAGSWTMLASRTDSSVTGAGYVGLLTDSTDKGWSFDDFGGGTAVTAEKQSFYTSRRRMVGARR